MFFYVNRPSICMFSYVLHVIMFDNPHLICIQDVGSMAFIIAFWIWASFPFVGI
jgi:hypothetical protein